MSRYTLSHLSDQTLMHELRALVSRDRATTALLVAHLGEVDSRRLYAEAGYPSMFSYCVEELRFAEESAYKRIRAARTARQFPAIHGMLADGRLHLSAVVLLASCLTAANAEELLAAAAHRSKAGVEQLLAERFPRPDLPSLIQPVSAAQPPVQLSPGTVKFSPTEHPALAPGEAAADALPSPTKATHQIGPLAPSRFAVQFTIGQEAHDDLLYAQALLGHCVPSADPGQVFTRALKVLIVQLERRKFAGTDRPRPCRTSENPRHIPADVKRAVWERDGGRCTFVGESGHRCESRAALEFDHIEPVASGGRAMVGNLRLHCRAHNQYEAERHFGRGFMRTWRETGGKPPMPEHAAEVIPWLRQLGMRPEEARRWAECCTDMAEASLEERLRHALRCSARSSPRRAA